MNADSVVAQQLAVITTCGGAVEPGARVLDLGCGNGDLVLVYRERGFDGFGCDMTFKPGDNVDALRGRGWIRVIDGRDYRLPFDDQFFDVVVTNQVMEHVKDYDSTLKEIKRVMKPGAIFLHIFPARYRPIEPHIRVPFASVIQTKGWLRLWALIGVRNAKQKEKSWRQVAEENYEYLSRHTNYLRKKEMSLFFNKYFLEICSCEREYMMGTRKGRLIGRVAKYLPWLTRIYGEMRTRVVLGHR